MTRRNSLMMALTFLAQAVLPSRPTILHVTTMATRGPGSVYAALEQHLNGPRIVMFDRPGWYDVTNLPPVPPHTIFRASPSEGLFSHNVYRNGTVKGGDA